MISGEDGWSETGVHLSLREDQCWPLEHRVVGISVWCIYSDDGSCGACVPCEDTEKLLDHSRQVEGAGQMGVGMAQIRFVWPGIGPAIAPILVFVAMPIVLIFSVYRYTSIPKSRKIILIPVCVVAPVLIASVLPLLVSLSGLVRVGRDGVSGRADYITVYRMFGDYSADVWSLFSSIVVCMIAAVLRESRKSSDRTMAENREKRRSEAGGLEDAGS